MKIKVRTFAELERWAGAFANEPIQVLLVVGDPGLQKSTVIRQAVGGRARWIEGTCSAFRLYCELWKHRNQPFVIDDVDSLYTDRHAVRLLKCLCQTERRKTVAWHTDAATLRAQGIDTEFSTTSRCCLIANVWKTLNKNISAVEDRGILIKFQPPAKEVHRRVRAWFRDAEIYDFIGRHLDLIAEPSMRDYLNARTIKQAGMDWRTALLETWGLNEQAILFLRLRWDKALAREKDRAAAFTERGGGSRSTYFRLAQRFRDARENA
jgi:hypothetical protein